MTEFDALLLAAGRGRRMGPLTAVVPKPLLPLGDQPILHHVLAEAAAAGARRIRVVVGPGAPQLIRAHLEAVRTPTVVQRPAVDVLDVCTDHAPHPVQALARCPLPTDRAVLAMHCDELVPAAVSRLLTRTAVGRNFATVAVLDPAVSAPQVARLTEVRETGEPGGGLTDQHRVVGRMAIPSSVVRRLLSRQLLATTLVDLAATLLREGMPVLAVQWPGPFIDIGEPRRYRAYWKPPYGDHDER